MIPKKSPAQSMRPYANHSDGLADCIMTNRRSPWWNHGAYPKGKSFAEMFDWHLSYWGTRPGCSLEFPNPCESVSSLAEEFHEGMRAVNTPTNPETKLANWRKGKHPPGDDIIISNILQYLFEGDDRLTAWKGDLVQALERVRKERKQVVPLGNMHVSSPTKTWNRFENGKLDQVSFHSNEETPTPLPDADFELLEEQSKRLRIEQRTNARQSAQLLAAEAKRCNEAGKFNAGMRFALAGWLATEKNNVDCIPEIEHQLAQGARGIRLVLEQKGACLHAHLKNAQGHDVFIISKDKRIFGHNINSGEIIDICEFRNGFTVEHSDQNISIKLHKSDNNTLDIASGFADHFLVELIWPLSDGRVVYLLNDERRDVAHMSEKTSELVKNIPHFNTLYSFKISSGGSILTTNNYIPDFDGNIYSVSAYDVSNMERILYSSPAFAIAVSPDDSIIAVEKDKSVSLYNRSGILLSVINIGYYCSLLKFSKSGDFLFSLKRDFFTENESVSGEQNVHIFDVKFEKQSLYSLIEFICNHKLRGEELFSSDDLRDSLYASVPIDIVDQCRRFLGDMDH
jgi:hypothetical protein